MAKSTTLISSIYIPLGIKKTEIGILKFGMGIILIESYDLKNGKRYRSFSNRFIIPKSRALAFGICIPLGIKQQKQEVQHFVCG